MIERFYDYKRFCDDQFCEYENGKITSFLIFTITNGTLKIEDINSKDAIDESYHHGTELMINFLQNQMNKGVVFTRIHGRLSSVDAADGWRKSIPFYANLPHYINNYFHTNYVFHLYDGLDKHVELTDSYNQACQDGIRNDYIEKLIQEHLKINGDLCFEFVIV